MCVVFVAVVFSFVDLVLTATSPSQVTPQSSQVCLADHNRYFIIHALPGNSIVVE